MDGKSNYSFRSKRYKKMLINLLILLLPLFTSIRSAVVIKRGLPDYTNPISLHAKTYKELINGKMFVDNSLFIEDVLSSNSDTRLMIGPRHSGKTLNLDMLKTFLEMPIDEEGEKISKKKIFSTWSYNLFYKNEIIRNESCIDKLDAPLLISKNTYTLRTYQGKFPVIYATFKDVVGNNYTEVEKSLRKAVARSFREHTYLYKTFEKMNKSEDFEDQYLAQSDLHDFESTLNGTRIYLENSYVFLCKVLHQTFNQYPFVLIDDYDMPLVNTIRVPDFPAEDRRKLFNLVDTIISYTFARNNFLHKGIAVGTYKLKQLAVHNAWQDYQFDDIVLKSNPITQHFGFRYKDIGQLLTTQNISAAIIEQLPTWYNGYQAIEVPIKFYNPFSAASFINKQKLATYWYDEVTEIIIDRVLQNNSQTRSLILPLLSRQSLQIPTNSEFDPMTALHCLVNDIPEYLQAVITHLYRTGYLTTLKYTDLVLQLDIMVHIPNNDILSHLSHRLMSHQRDVYHLQEKHLNDAATHLLQFINTDANSDFTSLQNSLQHLYKESKFSTDSHQPTDPKSHEEDIHLIFSCVALKAQSLSGFRIDIYHDKIMQMDIVLANNHTKLGVAVDIEYSDEQMFEYPLSTYKNLFCNTTYDIDVVKLLAIKVSSQKDVRVEILE